MERAVHWTDRLLLTLFLMAVPTLMVASNVWWAFRAPPLYDYGFSRNGVSEATGISPEGLRHVARAFTDYFTSPKEFLDIRVQIYGVEQPFLNQRELIHMRDVKGLVRGVARTQAVALLFIGLYAVMGFVRFKRGWAQVLARRLRMAGVVSAVGVVVVGVLLAVAFPALFRLFHVVSFSNPFWQLDPRTDYLVRLFPSQFFFEATMLIAVATLVEAALLAALAWGWLRSVHSREAASAQQAQGAGPPLA